MHSERNTERERERERESPRERERERERRRPRQRVLYRTTSCRPAKHTSPHLTIPHVSSGLHVVVYIGKHPLCYLSFKINPVSYHVSYPVPYSVSYIA